MNDYNKQIEWENFGVSEGIRKFDAELAKANGRLGNTAPGQSIMTRLLPRTYETMKSIHAEAVEIVTSNSKGAPKLWALPFCSISPKAMAVVGLNVVFNSEPREGMLTYPISRLAKAISNAVHQQIDYDMWEHGEKAKKRADPRTWTHLDELNHTVTNLHPQSFGRFSSKIGRVRLEKWDQKVGIALGSKVLRGIEEASPDWFTSPKIWIMNGKSENHFAFTKKAHEAINDTLEKHSLAAPRLLPTIIKPRPWQHVA